MQFQRNSLKGQRYVCDEIVTCVTECTLFNPAIKHCSIWGEQIYIIHKGVAQISKICDLNFIIHGLDSDLGKKKHLHVWSVPEFYIFDQE